MGVGSFHSLSDTDHEGLIALVDGVRFVAGEVGCHCRHALNFCDTHMSLALPTIPTLPKYVADTSSSKTNIYFS
ncbi:transposase for insertion sequence element [Corynebacterium kutscheri]|uniref:Transposase for insertion sequence element n=1 Tax=Corynebacterium kutscheri TaxID=35755 RepID=A0AB38VRT0_9CORY|nr:transposase for insertion sequence element [Corynebacterium kutscheri]VEH10768.1 transposase for insertion sequence element [Corynebacterium kutscheri]